MQAFSLPSGSTHIAFWRLGELSGSGKLKTANGLGNLERWHTTKCSGQLLLFPTALNLETQVSHPEFRIIQCSSKTFQESSRLQAKGFFFPVLF
jgi:hypothetical protein